jgi:DNA polymerase
MPVKKSAAVSAPPVSKPVTPPAKTAVPLGGDRLAALHIIKEKTLDCTRCTAFSGRTQAVFGVGNVQARVVFFGEAPGADEDRLGEPFVGKAGQLLNKIIEACTFKREDVYIMNVCKCRPPENRTPLEDEIENCREFFEAQFAVLEPEYIVCLGATAVKALFGKSAAIGKLRGKLHDWRGSKVLATYHPAYLLRNPEAKKDVWADMQILLRDMGITLPAKSS